MHPKSKKHLTLKLQEVRVLRQFETQQIACQHHNQSVLNIPFETVRRPVNAPKSPPLIFLWSIGEIPMGQSDAIPVNRFRACISGILQTRSRITLVAPEPDRIAGSHVFY